MQIQDDRTTEQKFTHRWLVIGTDSFLSGWGKAEGGQSYEAWAYKPINRDKVLRWVKARSDMKRVREAVDNGGNLRYRPSGPGHCHIYVVDDGHPALA